MKIYLKDTTEFNNNGLGFLTDILSAKVYDELNGNYYLEFEYLLNGKLSEYLVKENIVKCKVADGSEQLFIINNIEKNLKTIKITARHIFYRLIDNFLEDVYPKNLNGNTFLNWILEHTNYESGFTGYSNISNYASARYVRKNPIEAILGDDDNSMVNIFGGEIKRDNFTINFLTSIGSNKNEKLIFGKNIKEINIKEDATTILTRIMPIGFDGLILPERYIDSDLIDVYSFPKIGIVNFDDIKYDPDDADAYHDIQEAYQVMRDRVSKLYENGIDKSNINIKINWLELSKTKEYEQYSTLERLYLGDSVICNIAGLDYSTKVIKTVYNVLTDTIDKFEIGTPSSNIGSSMNNINTKIEHINPQSIIEYAKNNATDLITQAMGGYIYKTQSELYIMDTNNPQTAQRVWRWNINGLGYSSTGINGPYELAMTMNGQIVADFITTGRLNTNVIEGYDQLVTKVSNVETTVQDITTTTQTSEGNNSLYIEDAKEDRVIEYSVDGATEQTTYTGKNLLPNNLTTRTINGITFTKNKDGSVLVNGTASDLATIYIIGNNILSLSAGTYTLSGCPSNGSDNTYRMDINDGGNVPAAGTSIRDFGSGKTFTLTETLNITNVRIRIASGTTVNNLLFKPMIEKTSSKTDYEPYVGGIPSPNPSYPQEVETIPSIVNLLKVPSSVSRTFNGVTYTLNDDGSVTLSGTSTSSEGFYIDLDSPIVLNGDYIFSLKTIGTISTTANQQWLLKPSDNSTITALRPVVQSNTTRNTSGTVNNTITKLQIYTAANTTFNCTVYPMLEEGTVVHEYIPYGHYARVKVTGKNLLNYKTSVNGSIPTNSTSETLNSDNKAITSAWIPCKPNTTYTISGGKNRNRWQTKASNGTISYFASDSATITTNSTAKYLRCYYYYGSSSIEPTSIQNVQIEECSTPTAYEEYKEKQVLIDLKKENLFDSSNANILNVNLSNDNYISGESPSNRVLYIPIKENTTYTINKVLSSYFRIGTTTDIPTYNEQYYQKITNNTGTSITITTNQTAKYLIVWYYNSGADTLTEQQILDSITIYESNNPTPYYELCKIGDYKDTLTIDNNGNCSIDKKIRKRVLNGSESWTLNQNYDNSLVFLNYGLFDDRKVGDENNFYSNNFSYLGNAQTEQLGNAMSFNPGRPNNHIYIYIQILKTIANSLANFKTWLGTHNTDVYYVLATSETIPLPNVQIPLYEGINHITLVDDLETETSVTYYRKTPISDSYAYQRDLNTTNSNLSNTNNQVSQNSSDIKNTNNNLSNNYYTKPQVDSINTTTVQQITAVRNQVLTNQTATEYSINVINEQLVNGVTKFNTGTGFTFDIEGLKINKTDNTFKVLINNEGLLVSNNDELKLSADHTGVVADNIEVKKFYIQKPIRIEKAKAISDNTKDVLALFWVGVD